MGAQTPNGGEDWDVRLGRQDESLAGQQTRSYGVSGGVCPLQVTRIRNMWQG